VQTIKKQVILAPLNVALTRQWLWAWAKHAGLCICISRGEMTCFCGEGHLKPDVAGLVPGLCSPQFCIFHATKLALALGHWVHALEDFKVNQADKVILHV
jgi:hypothetical protein